jgi:hypothetical protein
MCACVGCGCTRCQDHLLRTAWTAGSAGCVTIATTLAIELLGGAIGQSAPSYYCYLSIAISI